MPVPPRLAVKTPLTRPGQQCGAESRRGGRAAVDAPVSFLLEVEPDKPHDVRLGGQIGHQVRDPGRLRAACFTGGGLRDEDWLSGGDAAELGDAESKQILRRDPAGHKIVDVLPGARSQASMRAAPGHRPTPTVPTSGAEQPRARGRRPVQQTAALEEVLPVMVRLPGTTAGMVMPALKVPEAVVVTEKVADPAMTVPVVEALKPVPETVTAEPAGRCPGFSVICAAAAGAAPGRVGCLPVPRQPPRQAQEPRFSTHGTRQSIPQSRRGVGHRQAVLDALALIVDAKPAVSSRKPQFFSKTHTGQGKGPNLKKEICLEPPPHFQSGRPQRKGPS